MSDYHGKGEQDARDDEYEKPHGILDELTTWSKEGQERNERENDEYDKGYYHGKGQQDASEGEHHRPHGILDELTTWSKEGQERNERENDAYDAGHDSASSQKSGGCFLTTACVEFVGLQDDCHELIVLRHFRDNYLANLPDGKSMISEYYRVAPCIVAGIARSPSREKLLAETWTEIQKSVSAIDDGDNASALTTYMRMFSRLKRDVLEVSQNCRLKHFQPLLANRADGFRQKCSSNKT